MSENNGHDIPNTVSRLWIIFSLSVFGIMASSSIILGALTLFGLHIGIVRFSLKNPTFPILVLLIISCVIGTAISIFIGRRILKPIEELRSATKRVAKGDFSVRVNEDSIIPEIHDIKKNFNIMVRELDGTETLRGDFMVNVSHEFKTPLAAIEGYATLLQAEDITSEERMEYTKMIIESTHALSELTGNILSLSKLENQEIIAEKTEIHIDEQIRNALLLSETQWSAKNIELDIDLDDVVYYGNENLMMTIWINLITNAVKFTPENGTIRTEAKQIDNFIYVTVTDNGVGMSDEVKKHIFEKFYQGDKSHSSAGNGLGLALVKRITELCGGEIIVKSELGKGSEFQVILPVTSH